MFTPWVTVLQTARFIQFAYQRMIVMTLQAGFEPASRTQAADGFPSRFLANSDLQQNEDGRIRTCGPFKAFRFRGERFQPLSHVFIYLMGGEGLEPSVFLMWLIYSQL